MAAKRKKGFTLRITFHGIVRPVEDKKRGSVTMLLCKLDPKTAERGTSYVLFDERNYRKKGNRQIDETKKWQHIFVLDDEFLSIDANVVPRHRKKLSMNTLKDPLSDVPTAYDERSLRWLVDLDELTPGYGQVNPGYLQRPPAGTPPLVARMDLKQGHLRTNGVEKVLVPFRTKKGDEKALAIARELVLEMDIEGDGFTLQSDPLAGQATPRSTAKDMHFLANGNDVIDITIGNEAYKGIYDDAPPIVPIDVLTKKAAREFEFYYSMSANQSKDPFLPYVASRQPGTSFCDVPHP